MWYNKVVPPRRTIIKKERKKSWQIAIMNAVPAPPAADVRKKNRTNVPSTIQSLVTSLLAIQTRRLGYETAVLDADITGPSIPKIFGIHDHAQTDEQNLLPYIAADGTKDMSLNLLLENETDPVFWRGPVISGVVKQFWEEVSWGDVDFMFVDMPPGTGDVPLTVFQSLPLDGIIIVSTPQSLVSMIVQKAVSMAQRMDIPVLGMVENMRFIKCPDCGKEIPLFGSDDAVNSTMCLFWSVFLWIRQLPQPATPALWHRQMSRI